MSAFLILTGEAIRDAARRRIVAVIAVLSLLSLMIVESCTSCSPGEVIVDGQLREMVDFSGYTGAVTFISLGLWCVVLAGVLAAEHLAQTLADGSATLGLSRPVGRFTFAAARLAGALSIAWGTTLVLLGGTAFFLSERSDLPLAPAAWAGVAVGVSGLIVGAAAMALSLYLPRMATVLVVFAGVGTIFLANASELIRESSSGFLGWVDQLGPPLLTSLALALSPWVPQLELPTTAAQVTWPLALWAAASVAFLAVAFRRFEI